jgi:hypothetical protein
MKVHICENTTHGKKAGKACAIIFFYTDCDIMLHVETITMDGEPLRSTDSIYQHIIYNGQYFKHGGTQWWAGNMMWNGYNMADDHALGFINALHRSRRWMASEAWVEISEAWDKPDELPGELFELPGVQPAWMNPNQSALL